MSAERDAVRAVESPEVESLFKQAELSERKRAHLLLHDGHSDPVQRFLIALWPGSYIQPHRHPEQWKLFTLLNGDAEVMTFGADGQPLRRYDLRRCRVIEVVQGCWNMLIARSPRTLLLEVKPGPFRAVEPAPWAPREGDPAVRDFLDRLSRHA